MPGPAPKPDDQRARRNARPAKVYLPAAGRTGAAPRWPLRSSTAEERSLWTELWTTPQAVAWERLRVHRTVAQYVRWTLSAEDGNLDSAPEARMLADRLGLSPLALRRLEWEVTEAPAAAPATTAAGSTVVDARARFGDLTPAGAGVDAAPGAGS